MKTLSEIISGFACVERDVELSRFSLYRCGGRAEALVRPQSIDELSRLLSCARENGIAVHVVGNGSNILFSDKGLAGVTIKLDSGAFCGLEIDGLSLVAGAGVNMATLVGLCREKSLSGFEFLWGVPATVGGALAMNAGAQGRDIAAALERVEVAGFDGRIAALDKSAIDFGYRSSSLASSGVVTRAWFRLARAASSDIEAVIDACRKQKVWAKPGLCSCGCVFKNPGDGTSAGKLLDSLGAKGMRQGGAAVSPEHANVIVNAGGATAADIFTLLLRLEEMALGAGCKLEPEIKLMGDFSL